MEFLGIDGQTITQASMAVSVIAILSLAVLIRRWQYPKPHQHEYRSSLEVPTVIIYTSSNVEYRHLYRTRTDQFWVLLDRCGRYFEVGVLPGYWNGFGRRPKPAFRGWTARLPACSHIEPDDLLHELPFGAISDELIMRLAGTSS